MIASTRSVARASRFASGFRLAIATRSATGVRFAAAYRHDSATIGRQKACGKCGTALPISSLSCSSCATLQPLPSELDAYQLLDIDQSQVGSNGWDVDGSDLKSIWRKRMALSHPDRMGAKDEVSI